MADLETVLKHMPYSVTQTTTGMVAYDDNTAETVAIFLCEGWTKTSVQVHQVIINPMVLRHGFFEECARYVFTIAARKTMYGLVPSNNAKALSVNEKIGFTEIAILEDAYDEGIDYILMELKRDNCNFWVLPEELKVAV
jgi:hypothetical protein